MQVAQINIWNRTLRHPPQLLTHRISTRLLRPRQHTRHLPIWFRDRLTFSVSARSYSLRSLTIQARAVAQLTTARSTPPFLIFLIFLSLSRHLQTTRIFTRSTPTTCQIRDLQTGSNKLHPPLIYSPKTTTTSWPPARSRTMSNKTSMTTHRKRIRGRQIREFHTPKPTLETIFASRKGAPTRMNFHANAI